MVHGTNYGAMYVIEFINPVSSLVLSPPSIQLLSKWKSFESCSFTMNDFLEYKPPYIEHYKLVNFSDLEPKAQRLKDYYYGCLHYEFVYRNEENFTTRLQQDLIYSWHMTQEEKQKHFDKELAKFRYFLSITLEEVNELLNLELELNEEQKNGLKIIMDLEKENIKWHGWRFTSYNY
jgi:hypothetical protein